MSTINSEFFEALALLEKERGIPMTYLIEKISNAIAVAIKRDMGGSENTIVEIDPVKRRFYVAVRKQVVEEVEDPENEITLQDATKYSKVAHVGGMVEIPLETKQFGRIAAQSAKHVIRQGISEAEKGQLVQKYQDKKYEIIRSSRLTRLRATLPLKSTRAKPSCQRASRFRARCCMKVSASWCMS